MSEMCKVEVKNNGHSYRQWALSMLVNLTLFTYGMQFGWVSPMTKVLQSNHSPTGYPLSNYDLSWIASVVCLTALLTVRVYATVVDRFGRRTGVLTIALFQAICWIVKIFATSTTALIISRVFCGIPAGACYSIIPLYVREISSDKIRGKLGSLFILFQNTGVLVMYAMGAYLDYYVVLYIVTTLSVVTLLAFLLVIPETPAFLIKLGKFDQAASTLAKLRGLNPSDELLRNELDTMKTSESTFKSLPTVSFISIFKNKAWRRGFIIILSLVVTQSMSGNFAILTYAPGILSSLGVTISPELQTLSFPIFLIIGSIISMNVVERFGRKMLLATTFIVGVLSMTTLGTVILVQQNGASVPSWLAIVAIAAYSCAYAAGIAPMPYIVMSEMFNFQMLLATTFIVGVLSMTTLGTVILVQQNGASVPSWLAIVAIAAYSCAYAAGIAPMPYIVMSEMFNFQMLLATTFIVGVLSMTTLGTVILVQQNGASVPSWLAIVAIAAYSCAYAAGIAPMPYIVMSEMFNFQIRARIMGVLVTMAWVTSFTQLSTFTPITNVLGPYSTFYYYGGINLIGGLVALMFLPETRGKTVQQIETDLMGKQLESS